MDAKPERCVEADVLHRGVRARSWFETGTSTTSWEFTSTSLRANKGQEFAGIDRGELEFGTYIQVHGGCGVSIRDLSRYPSEDEVLLLPGVNFDVSRRILTNEL